MNAELTAFTENLENCGIDKLRETCISIFQEKQALSRRMKEVENATTEMALQFQQMKMERDAALHENEELKKQNVHLTQVLALRQQEMFGKSSEKASELQSSANEEHSDPLSEDAEAEQDGSQEEDNGNPGGRGGGYGGGRKDRKPKTTRKEAFAGLPRQNVYELDVDELNRMYGEGNWRIANWHTHDTVELIRQTSYLRVIHTPVISVGMEHCMVTIPWENYLISKSYVTASLLAQIMLEKNALHIPFYRQEHDPDHFGFPLSRQTACNWVNFCAAEYFTPVYEYLCLLLRDQLYQQCDETTWHNLHAGENAGKVQYIWIHCTSELSDEKRIIVYCYEDSRSAEHLRRFYAGLDHPIHLSCDAFSAYPSFAAAMAGLITLCGCLMHCRRRFVDAARLLPAPCGPDQDDELPEWKAIHLIGDSYKVENVLKDLTSEERLKERREKVKGKMDAFFEFIRAFDIDRPDVTDKMKDAVSYAGNQENELRQFLNDGSVPPDNGEAERKARVTAVNRKNSLFSNSTDGANASAMIWSLIETAKAHGADAYYYLKYLLDRMPQHTRPTAVNPPDYLEKMLPWSEEYRDYEREQKQMIIRLQIPPDQPRPVTPRKRKQKQRSA